MTEWIGSGSWGGRNATHRAIPPVYDAIVALLVATRHGWDPAGTTEPGGWSVTSETGQYRVRAGAYVLARHGATVAAADALELSLALSAALRGDQALRAAKPSPLLLGGNEAQNAAALNEANANWSGRRSTVAELARLAWMGSFDIVHPKTILTGFMPI